MKTNNQDTICAIATPSGGAIGIVRVSGANAIDITDSIFAPHNGGFPLHERKSHTLAFGEIHDEQGLIVDEVLVSLFRAPHSYTGEDSVEISCHGSSYILQQVVHLLITKGCRNAEPGEYTQRAFLNGKMDLSQAEAVADLIATTSAAQHRMAINQMRGGISLELKRLRDKLLHLASMLELELDFTDHEDLEFASRSELMDISADAAQTIEKLVASFTTGNAIKNGIPVAIVGETNAGKSSLLNVLVGEDRAIVSDIHGTTRDIIEDTMVISGMTYRFIDTAGLRATTDEVEKIGIERTYKAIGKADVVLYVADTTRSYDLWKENLQDIKRMSGNKLFILVANKIDSENSVIPEMQGITIVQVSAKTGNGVAHLQQMLSQHYGGMQIESDVVVSNLRHYNALVKAQDALHRVINGITSGLSTELIAFDLRETLAHISDVIGGEISSDEVLGNIFSRFCIGK